MHTTLARFQVLFRFRLFLIAKSTDRLWKMGKFLPDKGWKFLYFQEAVGSQEIGVFWFYNVELAAIRKLCKWNYLQIERFDSSRVKVIMGSKPGQNITLTIAKKKYYFFIKNSKQWVFTTEKSGRFVPQLRRSRSRTILLPEGYRNRPISSILFRYFLRFFNFSSSRLILKRLRSFHPRSLWWWIRGSSQFHQPEGVQNDEMSWNDIFELFYVTRI